jgi:long-chain acyl-CoA synthetase
MSNLEHDNFANVTEAKSIADAFWRRAKEHPNSELYRYALASSPSATRVWKAETYSNATSQIARIAHFLAAQGVRAGTPVAILSNTRREWMLTDIAIQTLGGITVSIYQSLPAQEAGFILHDSGASIVFIENEEQAQKIAWLQAHECPIPERESSPARHARLRITSVIAFERVTSLGDIHSLTHITEDTSLSSTPPAVPESVTRESIASYVYTSGTTGPPKGVIQTHGNHLANVEQASLAGVFAPGGSMFLYLPLAHSFARLVYYVGLLTSTTLILPAIVDHSTSKLDLSSTARDIREGNATVLPSVPRLFEKMASSLNARASGKGFQNKVLGLCVRNAQAVAKKKAANQPLGVIEEILFNGLAGVRQKIRAQLFGVAFTHGISGGAKLDPEVNRFLNALGILICEGYGLTETCVATNVNLPTNYKIGSVGPAFRGVEIRVSPEDGEICMRGPNVTQGYLNRPQATREAWDAEGWFHSGDVGRVDEDGFLYITDRKKELVITAGGKKIPPTSIEGMFKRNSFISHAFFYGEGKPYCVILLTLNEAETRVILANQGIVPAKEQRLSELFEVRAMVESAVTRANLELASYETIKKFAIVDEDFSIENGLLTPTMKMKRKVISQRYKDNIDALYS